MTKTTYFYAAAAAVSLLLPLTSFATDEETLRLLKQEIRQMRQNYESRISELETQLQRLESPEINGKSATTNSTHFATTSDTRRRVRDNGFNPSIGLILNGQASSFSSDSSEIAGFAVGEEAERGAEGFAIDHTELNFSANVDDKFYGSVTTAIAEHEGATEVELEEAYVQTLSGAGLPEGLDLKFGRALWTFGYLNEHHAHADDFSDRPLPYRVFLDGAFNDDGVQITYLLPTDTYAEVGAGAFRGNDFPFGESNDSGLSAYSLYGRIGGDISHNQAWRAGVYHLAGAADGNRTTNEDTLNYTGDTNLTALDLRYTYAPTANPRQQELLFQTEYFRRKEDGTYQDANNVADTTTVNDSSSGWYAQAVYKWAAQWRVGARYSRLNPIDTPNNVNGNLAALDAQGFKPETYSLMLDWTNSEFSRIRLQFNKEELSANQDDRQFIIQYIMSLGAHGAHKF